MELTVRKTYSDLVIKPSGFAWVIFFSKSTVKTSEFCELDQKFAVVKSFWRLCCQFWTSVCLLNSTAFLSKQYLVDAEFRSRKVYFVKSSSSKEIIKKKVVYETLLRIIYIPFTRSRKNYHGRFGLILWQKFTWMREVFVKRLLLQ